jgi:hypothetical protein
MVRIDIVDRWVTILAKRNSGKSQLCAYLIRRFKPAFREVFVISPTSFSGFWNGLVTENNIRTSWSEEWASRLIELMRDRNKGKTQKSPDFDRVLLVLDDLLSHGDVKANNSKTLRTLASQGRHYGISVLSTIHILRGSMGPLQRAQSDIIFIGQCNKASLDQMADEFSIGDMDPKKFAQMARLNSEDYSFLVIDCNTSSSELTRVYGSFRVPSSELRR